MGSTPACKELAHRQHWRCTMYKHNRSAFNGNRPTRSDYSEVWCPICQKFWRTKAAYVADLEIIDLRRLQEIVAEMDRDNQLLADAVHAAERKANQ